jgi:hypothetical protein
VSRRGWADPSGLDGEFSPACPVTHDLLAPCIKPDLGMWLEAFSAPEPRILGPLLWLVVDSTPFSCMFRSCERSSSMVRWPPLARFSDRKVSNDHGCFKLSPTIDALRNVDRQAFTASEPKCT